jgi:hypothetical protein
MQSGQSNSKTSSDKKQEKATAKTPIYRDLIAQGIQLKKVYIPQLLYYNPNRQITLDDPIKKVLYFLEILLFTMTLKMSRMMLISMM